MICELERVAKKVDENLAQPPGIAPQPARHRGYAQHGQREVFLVRPVGEQICGAVDNGLEFEINGFKGQHARLDL